MQRLTAFTRWGSMASGAALLAVLAARAAGGDAMFSPGALHAARDSARVMGGVAAHAQLSRDCAACHTPPWSAEPMSARCLGCHADTRAELGDTAALHGMLGDARRCLGCHTEHGGPLASLTRFDGRTFPHDRFGFSLAAHPRLASGHPFRCADCHTEQAFRFREATCIRCHQEYQAPFMARHRREWGDGCMACHDGIDRFTGFRHDTTAYPLTGAHARAECAGCHRDARRPADFAAAPSACIGCHRDDDEHRGEFGQDCAGCHGTETWEGARFDHEVFPVAHGSREPSACRVCHQDAPASYRAYTCYGCHEHTPANVRAEHVEEGIRDYRDCVRCHRGGETEGEGGEGERDHEEEDEHEEG